MRIRTRYTLFKAIGGLGVLVFLLSLYDMFANDAALQAIVLLSYAVLLLSALVLYVGYKPNLDTDEPLVSETIESQPDGQPDAGPDVVVTESAAEATEVVEVPKTTRVALRAPLRGTHHFRCPFCSNVFAFEASHLERGADFRMGCPYCVNRIRIPKTPKVGRANLKAFRTAAQSDQVSFACSSCDETVRITAPFAAQDRRAALPACPRCGRATMAAVAA